MQSSIIDALSRPTSLLLLYQSCNIPVCASIDLHKVIMDSARKPGICHCVRHVPLNAFVLLGHVYRYALVARAQNEVQEIRVESSISRDELKAAVEAALAQQQDSLKDSTTSYEA